jgi:hypothetical protein
MYYYTTTEYVLHMKNNKLSKVQAVNTINQTTIWEQKISSSKEPQRARGLSYDSAFNVLFLYTDTSVFEIEIQHENKDAWLFYLQKGLYDRALAFSHVHTTSSLLIICRTLNKKKKSIQLKLIVSFIKKNTIFQQNSMAVLKETLKKSP